MKVQESGMPEEKLWETFFKPEDILRNMGLSKKVKDVADFGSGHDTFTLPAAKLVSGMVYAIDMEKTMVESLKVKVDKAEDRMNEIQRQEKLEGEGYILGKIRLSPELDI